MSGTMTRMLVCLSPAVDAASDAAIAASGGCDVVDIASSGSEVDAAAIAAIRAVFPGVLRIRLGVPLEPALLAAAALGADEIALPAAAVPEAAAFLDDRGASRPVLVAIVQADDDLFAPLGTLAGHVRELVLEVGSQDRLIDRVAIAKLDAFVHACHGLGLRCGLAGGLEAPDVARLLLLQPDLLGFDRAVRRDQRADQGLDAKAVETMRALIPHDHGGRGADGSPPTGSAHADQTDHIFVHDFVALLSIGAYQAERGVRQRVRFSVDADVRRPVEPPTDMRGVFSYDIIIETIRMLASRAHVTFVETLAEELATRLLAYPQLSVVGVKVEKLDVIEGAVGIAIRRDRSTAARLVASDLMAPKPVAPA